MAVTHIERDGGSAAAVTGTVATSGTTPIAGATVAYALNGSLQTVTATASGGFTASVPNGTYVFEANAQR